MAEEPSFREGMELIAPLMEASMQMTQDTTNRLIDGVALSYAQAEAELILVRERIMAAITGDYMPTSLALSMRLMVSRDDPEFLELVRERLDLHGIHSSAHEGLI